VQTQARDVIRRHHKEAVIVYCLSRKDTESMADALRSFGVNARAYHAGLSADERHETQDAFADESLDVVTATVAFGMGIDRSNVRCIIHATIPKSIEHYQQETGRAGRDGLEAECVLFYSAGDVMRWESLFRRSAEDADDPEAVVEAKMQLLNQMRRFSQPGYCRHRALTEHFGQTYDKENCEACDECLGETEGVEDGTDTARKIMSCVARVRESFGVTHVVDVLTGANTERVRERGHDELSTYALLKGTPPKALMNWIHQLVDQGLLERTPGDRPVLCLNESSWEVMRGDRSVKLMQAKTEPVKKTRSEVKSWDGVDHDLFEHLREVRKGIARERSVPAFVIFGDATLRDMARKRPGTTAAFRDLYGVGDAKLKKFGKTFIAEITAYCRDNELSVEGVGGRSAPSET
jgi:ATP-dependent DNA helicase RecQ